MGRAAPWPQSGSFQAQLGLEPGARDRPPFLFALSFQLPLTLPPTHPQASTVLGLFSLLFPPCCPLTLLPLSQSVSFPVSPPRFPVSLHLPARQDQPPHPFSPCQEAAEPGVKADLCEVPRGHAVLRGGSGQRHSMEAAPHRQPRGPAHPLQARGQGSGARLAGAGSRHRSMNTPLPRGLWEPDLC